VQALLAQTGAPLQRSAAEATPHFTWHDAQGQHIVHYEDAVSLAAKLQAVLAQGARGLAFWRLGQEEPSQWPVIARAAQHAL
jgi:spore germination protein